MSSIINRRMHHLINEETEFPTVGDMEKNEAQVKERIQIGGWVNPDAQRIRDKVMKCKAALENVIFPYETEIVYFPQDPDDYIQVVKTLPESIKDRTTYIRLPIGMYNLCESGWDNYDRMKYEAYAGQRFSEVEIREFTTLLLKCYEKLWESPILVAGSKEDYSKRLNISEGNIIGLKMDIKHGRSWEASVIGVDI